MSFWNIYRGKKVLITGHTGFKGSWLAMWLKELGAEIYGYALEPQTTQDNFVLCNLSAHIHHEIGNVCDYQHLKMYFDKVQPDFAFHLAAQPLVLLSYQEPRETFETNLIGVVNFFEAVRSTPSVKVAINVTSDKCYDNKEWIWGYRENDAMGGKDPYSASKGCAELITASYAHSFFTESSCLIGSARAGNVIGGGDWAKDRIIPDYYRAVKGGRELVIRNPYATRPWQHVLEPLSGYLTLGAKLWNEGRVFSGAWNFGPEDNANYSVHDLIQRLVAFDQKGRYSIEGDMVKPHEAVLLKLDISKAVNILHWRPVLSYNETVRFTAEGYNADLGESHDRLYQCRVDQITEYSEIAAKRKIEWAL